MIFYTDELLEALNRWNGILSAPSKEALKKPNGIRVFKNPIFEYGIARAHPIIPGLWVFPLVWFLVQESLHRQSVHVTATLVLAAFFSFTLIEYGIHRFIFHWKITPETNRRWRDTVFMLHGYHHEYPNDPTRLVMPIALAWPLATIIACIVWAVFGTGLFFGIFAGILLGYLAYDWMHYYTHHIRPTTAVGKYLHEFHAIHHYVNETTNYGISSPIWDWVLSSAKEPRNSLLARSL